MLSAAPAARTVGASQLQHGGVTLDGYGGVHPFGGLSLDSSGAPYWAGWDIARAVVVRADGSGGWTLDGYGGIHAWGSAPTIKTPAYWPYWDIARDLVVTSTSGGVADGAQGYILDGYGAVHPWGGAPALTGVPYSAYQDIARGLAIHYSSGGVPDGGWEIDKDGSVHAFGAAPALHLNLPNDDVALKLHLLAADGSAGYVVNKWGILTTFGSGVSPYWSGYSDWGSWDILRDIQLLDPTNPTPQTQPSSPAAVARFQATLQPHGGVLLDGYGGLHPFGGLSVDVAGAPYWPYWDVARSVVVRADGSGGWTLDGFGGIHAWGRAPPIQTPGYWPNWDIARAIVVTSTTNGIADGRQGYLLDGFGGLHPWGGAPQLGSGDLFPGFDIAVGLEIHYSSAGAPDGAWILDEFGVVHSVGAAPALGDLSPYGERPVYHAFHASGSGYYLVGKYGVVVSSGSIGDVYWNGYSDWGSWDIVRDIAIVNPANPDEAQAQPVSNQAGSAFQGALGGSYGAATPLYRQTMPLDCESAATQMALAARGTYVSQSWLVARVGADTRPAVTDRYGDILQWGDPYQTFVGNIDGSEWNATGYGVYYPPLASAVSALGHGAMGKQGWQPADLYAMVSAGDPAVVWVPYQLAGATTQQWTAWDGRSIPYIRNEHAMTVVEVDFGAGTVTLNDPEYGVHVVSMGFFEQEWSYLGNMALVVG